MGVVTERRLISEAIYRPESIEKFRVCSNQEKARIQVAFMRSFSLDRNSGRYELKAGEKPHVFDTVLPDVVHGLLSNGRATVFLARHNYTEFNWGGETIIGEPFLALHWISSVDKKGNAEEFMFRLNGFSEQQAEKFLESFLEKKYIDAKFEEDNLVSFTENFDPLDHPSPFIKVAAEKILDSQDPLTRLARKKSRDEFMKQISNLALMRYLTHNPDINNFKVPTRFVIDENGKGCLIAFDQILGRWGRMDSSSTNAQIIHNIQVTQQGLDQYYKDPNPFKGNFHSRMPTMLSARTAGLRPGEDKSADQTLTAKPNGEIDLNTDIVPTRTIPPELFLEPGISILPPVQGVTLPPYRPINPFLQFGDGPFLQGGGGFSFSMPSLTNFNRELHSAVPVVNIAAVGLAILAPSVFSLENALMMANFQTAVLVLQDDVISANNLPQNTESVQKEIMGESNNNEVLEEVPTDLASLGNIFWSEEPEPILPDGNGGGGGRALSREITTILDEKMEQRFNQTRENLSVATDTVLPKGEIVFDATRENACETKFHEFASDLEIPIISAVSINDENVTALLSTSVKEERRVEIDVQKINKPDLQMDIVSINNKQERKSRYNAREKKKDADFPNQTTAEVAVGKFAEDVIIPNALLADYIRWRDFIRQVQTNGLTPVDNPTQEITMDKNTEDNEMGKPGEDLENDKFIGREEKNNNIPQKQKLRLKKFSPNPAFLSLLLLTKIKILRQLILHQQNNTYTKLKQLFVADTLFLFLLNPKLFLIRNN